ncbi:hypothetical protein B7463_g399, partial [Scytalidium lignicola]
MDVFDAFTWATGGWLALQAVPLMAFPTVIIAMLSPEIREPSRTSVQSSGSKGHTNVRQALEEYFSRCLGLNLLTIAILVIVLTGAIPLTSSVPGEASAGVTSAAEDPKTPYASAVTTIATVYHAASAVFCYVSHHTTGRWGLMMGTFGSGVLGAVGLWCLLFASSTRRISKRTGADKRTSGFPFQNSASASAQKKAQKRLTVAAMTTLFGKEIGPIGYGLMGLTWRPQPPSDERCFAAMKAALAAGCNFWNGGEFYGTPEHNSLTLLARYFAKYPEDADKVILSIKGGYGPSGPDSSPEGVRRSLDNCIKLIDGKKKIDIFECSRVDKKTPIETTMKVLEEEYVKTGKIDGISLSEVGAATIRRAAAVTKIVAVEVELSLFSTDIFKNGVAETCGELNIPIVAYSPIGRGFLSGQLKSPDDIPDGEIRKLFPRFQPDAFEHNLELVRNVEKIAAKKGCTPAQLALGWVHQLSKKGKNPEIIPIPGASTADHATENGVLVSLTEEELAGIDAILSKFEPVGARYGGPAAAFMEG